MKESGRVRRTQEERTAETRLALIEATVRVVHRLGYGGASTALIAQDAGVSRGAMLHHFGTRAQLMADTVRWVFEQELLAYERIGREKRIGRRLDEWVELIWEVLRQPMGLAVLEILQATRSDPELAEKVAPIQAVVEENSVAAMQARFGGDEAVDRAVVRLLVYAVRGLLIAQALVPNPAEIRRSVDLLALMMRRAAPSGTFEDFADA